MSDQARETLSRWRLVLGKYAENQLPGLLGGVGGRMDRALDYIYSQEYLDRGVREEKGRGGTLDPSQLTVPKWLNEVRRLFPQDTVERIEKHALERYEMTDLVNDPQVLRELEPNMDLLKSVLSFRGHIKGDVLDEVRRIIREVVDELRQRLEPEVRQALLGRLNRFRRSPLKVARNLDWRGTIRKNLKHYDPERKRLMIQDVLFFSQVERHLRWNLILCIDQSGSMAGSVIHSAVMAGILSGLPLLDVRLVIFDTAVVDLSDHVDDPVEVLMNVQLGGGTDIGSALTYCERLVRHPRRTILILLSDFEEGASPKYLLSACRRLREAGVVLLGLASLDEEAAPYFDRRMAEQLAACGMDIAALTPKRLAEWLSEKMA